MNISSKRVDSFNIAAAQTTMKHSLTISNFLTLLLAVSASFLCGVAAHAGSDWAKSHSALARLLATKEVPSEGKAAYLAGVHVKLEPGWKTYWRAPGDSGIPPHFDWSASQNLKEAKVLFPAPSRLKDEIGDSIVYKDEVVFPVLITPTDNGKPVSLALEFAYGLCKDICVPAEAKLTLSLEPSLVPDEEEAKVLQKHLANVPPRRGKGDAARPSVQSVNTVLTGDQPHLEIEALFPKEANKRDLFVEANPEFYIPMSKLKSKASNGLTVFQINLDDTDDLQKLRGEMLTFTLVSDKGQSETTVELK